MKWARRLLNRLVVYGIAVLPDRWQTLAIRHVLTRRFFLRSGRWPNIESPQSFNENILRRIIYDRDPRLKIMCDKIAVRVYIKDRVGEAFVVPILGQWATSRALVLDGLPNTFVLKPSHSSGQVALIRGDFNRLELKAKARLWLSIDYFSRSLEWGYLGVPRRIIAEPFLRGPDGGPAVEVQVQVVKGRTVQIGIITGERGTATRFGDWFYSDGTRHPGRQRQPLRHDPLPSIVFDEIVPVAEKIAKDFDQMRVDFYLTDQGPKIGELTPYHSGAYANFDPPELDFEIGALWTEPTKFQS